MAQFVCECGAGFEQGSRYDQHRAASHPSAVSAAALEEALAGVRFPESKTNLVAQATRRTPMESVLVRALESLPDRLYRNAAEVVQVFEEARTAGHPDP